MKKIIFLAIIILFLFAVMYSLNESKTTKFVWEETFRTTDKQPYGAYVLDKILRESWEEGYSHSYESIDELLFSSENIQDKNLLILCNRFDVPYYQQGTFIRYLKEGGTDRKSTRLNSSH